MSLNDRNPGSRVRLVGLPVLAALASLVAVGSARAQGVGFGRINNVGGVSIDAKGMVTSPDKSVRIPLRDALRKQHASPRGELGESVGMRMVSLRRLDEAAQASKADVAENLPDELRFLAGIQRIQYVLVYPEEHDIVLAGPGEGWKVDDQGNVVGVTTGRPVLRLEDLIIAFRSVDNARQGGITCSIDPTAEGRQRLDQLLSKKPNFTSGILAAFKRALGPQQITVTGVPTDSRFARILVSSDYHMKRIAMHLDPSPIKELPSFIEMLKRDGTPLDDMMPRWWMECSYDPLGRSEDGLAFELRGRGVKVLTEEEIADAAGKVAGTGKANPTAQHWADLMTEHYDELAAKEASFGELRNLMDMCVVAAIIAKEQLRAKAGCELPTLAAPHSPLGFTALYAPKTVETQTSAIKRDREYIVTASGGVAITSWQVADRTVTDPAVETARAKAKPAGSASAWWNVR
jgi:hypothetical protein